MRGGHGSDSGRGGLGGATGLEAPIGEFAGIKSVAVLASGTKVGDETARFPLYQAMIDFDPIASGQKNQAVLDGGGIEVAEQCFRIEFLPAEFEFLVSGHEFDGATRAENTADVRGVITLRAGIDAKAARLVMVGSKIIKHSGNDLVRSASERVDIRTPKERGGAYQWSARDQSMPYEEIRKRWPAETAKDFETWARNQTLMSGRSLLDHFSGANPLPSITPATSSGASIATAIQHRGLDVKQVWTHADIGNLRADLKVPDPAKAADHIASITGTRAAGPLSEAQVRRTVQSLLDLVPRDMADTLPKLKIAIVESRLSGGANGEYHPGTAKVIITTHSLRGLKGEHRRREFHRVLSHELMHWLHYDASGIRADTFRKTIREHFATRTKGEEIIQGAFYKDKWYDLYAGKVYRFERDDPRGTEVPTRYYELWEMPDRLITLFDSKKTPDAAAHRETFLLTHSFLEPLPEP